jgi:hypothetical protein
MIATALELLAAFDALPPAEKKQVTDELLRRSWDDGDLPEMSLNKLAAELFRSYDAEEAARADP